MTSTDISARTAFRCFQSVLTFAFVSICLFLLSILTFFTLRKHLIPISHLDIPIPLGLPPSFDLSNAARDSPSYLASTINLSDPMYEKSPLDISHHSYRIELHCHSPRSYRNRQLGSFFVQIILSSTSEQLIIKQSRSILFPYQPALVNWIRTVIFLPLSILRIDYDRWNLKQTLIERLNHQEKSKSLLEINAKMNEHKCKGCLIDSTHGKLQKKKDALLEFIFADNSVCLTVSAQNVNIMAYTLSQETMASVIATSDLLVINLKVKKQIKISAIGQTKLMQLKTMLDALIHDDLSAYQISIKNFGTNSNSTSKMNQSTNSNILSESSGKKALKVDKMKVMENDENSQPKISNRNIFPSASSFYPHSEHAHSIDENTDLIAQHARKRTSENQSSSSTIRFEHATNTTSPYFFQRTDNKLKRNISNGESRASPLANIHSKPLNNRTRLWDDDEDNYAYDWSNSTSKIDQQSSTDISLSKAVTTTMNLRKKGLKNIGATCYMNSILQCLLNIDPFRYDLMVTNSELITSTLLEDNTIYLCVLQILALLQDRQSTQSQNNTTAQLADDERTAELHALSKKAN